MASITATPPAHAPPKTAEPSDKRRKIIIFSDFDGTIFMQDTGHVLVDNVGCGPTERETLLNQFKTGERAFRDVSTDMWGSLSIPFEDGFDIMKPYLQIDPDFGKFHTFCLENNIPFNVISAGLKPVLRRVLDGFLGEQAKHIDIVANDAIIKGDGSAWKPVWLHETPSGLDKGLSIQEAREKAEADLVGEDGTIPLIVFIGDGVSDLEAASQADVLFARKGLKLEEYCKEHGIPSIPFETFASIQDEMVKIIEEDKEKTKGKGLPARFNPRANLWRAMSSRNAVPQYMGMTPSQEDKVSLWPNYFSEVKTPAAEGGNPLGSIGEDGAAPAGKA